MTWKSLKNSTTADPTDVNNNFYNFAQGSILPKSSVSVSFQNTDSAYDLGSALYKWDVLYCNNINYNSISSGVVTLFAEVLLDESQTSIEFSGLSTGVGNILCIGRIIGETQTGLNMYFNNDSGPSYGFLENYASGSTQTGDRTNTNSYIRICDIRNDSTAVDQTFFYMNMSMKMNVVGGIPTGTSTVIGQARGKSNFVNIVDAYVQRVGTTSFLYNESQTSEITSVKFIPVANSLLAGTWIGIWRFK